MIVFWILLLIISVVGYGMLMSTVLPRRFLKTDYIVSKPLDRGVKNVKETNGRSIVYQPAKKYRKFVTQYILSERDEKKILILKVDESVKYLNYDIVMFNGVGRIFNVMNVKELIKKTGYTEQIELPNEVAFVSLIVSEVNDLILESKAIKPVSGGKITGYVLISATVTAVEIFVAKLCLAYLIGGVFAESFLLSIESTIVTVAFAVIAILINVVAILGVTLKGGRTKVEKGDKK